MCRSRLYLSLSLYIYLYKRDDTWRLRGNKRRMESKLLRKNNLAPRKALSSSCGDPWGNWPRKRLVDWTRIFSFSPSLLGPARRLFISCNLFDVSAAAVASDWTLMLMATAAPRSAQLGLSPGSRVWAPEAVSFLFFLFLFPFTYDPNFSLVIYIDLFLPLPFLFELRRCRIVLMRVFFHVVVYNFVWFRLTSSRVSIFFSFLF